MNHQSITKKSQVETSAVENQTPTWSEVSEVTFWDESQIQAVIRHAGCTGRSPEEFFNKKWKRVLCHTTP